MEAFLDILNKKRQIAILIDPEKTNSLDAIDELIPKLNLLCPSFIFIGGSTVNQDDFNTCVEGIKSKTDIPVILFPGGYNQIHELADGILFLSLISGRNPDYLIGHQVESAHRLQKMNLEVIPTGYILIDGGKLSSVSYVSQTTPIPNNQDSIAVKTAIAGEMLGMKAIFMDAGSGAIESVPTQMIAAVKKNINVPLIIGGGMKSVSAIESAFKAGANLVVIGNKIEEDMDFLLDLRSIATQKSEQPGSELK